MKPVFRITLVAAGLAVAAACVQLPFLDRPCPTDGCPDGLVCVTLEEGGGVCRRASDVDAGPSDAGPSDGGAGDGGAGDGGAGGCAPPCGVNEACEAGQCVTRDCGTVTCGMTQTCANGGCVGLSCGNIRCALGAGCIDGQCRHLACAFVRCPPGSECTPAGTCAPTSCPDGGACAAGLVCRTTACEDLRCAGLSCAVDAGFEAGQRCFGGACIDCGGATEDCGNLTDDDCDGLADCDDPECGTKPCNDQNACTQGESCQGDLCAGGTEVSCPVGTERCREPMGACNPQSGLCEYLLKPATASCDDGNACTLGDACGDAGRCDVHTGMKTCPASGAQCRQTVCHPADGGCTDVITPDAGCLGNRCFGGQRCSAAGDCEGGVFLNPCRLDAGAHPQCAASAFCDSTSGACLVSDSEPCTPGGNACVVGACRWDAGGLPVRCEAVGLASDGARVDAGVVCCGGAPSSLLGSGNCGGCGLSCGPRACLDFGMCPGNQTGAGCQCSVPEDCPAGQTCVGTSCQPVMGGCAPGQMSAMCSQGFACVYPP